MSLNSPSGIADYESLTDHPAAERLSPAANGQCRAGLFDHQRNRSLANRVAAAPRIHLEPPASSEGRRSFEVLPEVEYRGHAHERQANEGGI